MALTRGDVGMAPEANLPERQKNPKDLNGTYKEGYRYGT